MATMTKRELPNRLLLGPGPANVHPQIMAALQQPVLGHLDPVFQEILVETAGQLRRLFGTENELTLAVTGTGFSGMESCLANLIEPGDTMLVGVNGFFGTRMADFAKRFGAEVVEVTAPWGQPLAAEDVDNALHANPSVKVVGIVHGETSTGVRQPIEEIARVAHAHGALVLMDAVTTLGGLPVMVDAWGVDAAYSASQKCVGTISGLAPLTLSPRARERLAQRAAALPTWYHDVEALHQYWSAQGFYHHTCSSTLVYGLKAALDLMDEEGIENRFARHQQCGDALKAGLEAMGLSLVAAAGHRLPMLTTVRIPDGAEDLDVRKALLAGHGIEIAGGLGPLMGQIWRIGLMGYAARPENVRTFLAAFAQILTDRGCTIDADAGKAAAEVHLAQ